MDKSELFDSLDEFTTNLVKTLSELEAMKVVVRETIEENTALRIENEKLRERLGQVEKTSSTKPGSSREGLNKIYLEGFHVCTVSYGQRRSEDCVFCDELLYRG